MPFGPYKDFDACMIDQQAKGKSKESAQKICGKMQADAGAHHSRFVIRSLAMSDTQDVAMTTFEALRVGKIHDRGAIFTKEMLHDYVRNFQDKVYNGADIQINLNHNRGSDAAGWIRDVFVEGDSLMLTVEWTELGMEKIQKKLYQFVSVEVIDEIGHWNTGKAVKNVLAGAALTNDPALGGQKPLELSKILLSSNTRNMNTFKVFLEELAKQDVVSKDSKAVLRRMFEQLEGEEQEEVKEEVEAVEAKEEEAKEEEPKEEEKKDGEEEEQKAEAEPTELSKGVNVQEFKAMQSELAVMKKREADAELNKQIDTLMFSKEKEKGFMDAERPTLFSFLSGLTATQVGQFSTLIESYKAVNLGEVGQDDTSADSSYGSLKEKAEKYAKENNVTFREAMNKITK